MSDEHNSSFEGMSSLLQFIGHTVPARARFVGEAIFSGIYTVTTIGLVAGNLGYMFTPFGPLVPFLLGSATGYTMGLYHFWLRSQQMTITYAQSYPKLLAHSLWTESRILVPSDVLKGSTIPNNNNNNSTEVGGDDTKSDKNVYDTEKTGPMKLENWIANKGLHHFSLCILAAYSCKFDVLEVDKLNRQKMIEASVVDED